MQTLKTVIGIAWLIFWGYWLISAACAKMSVKGRGWRPLAGVSVLCVFLLTRVIKGGTFVVHSPILGAIGAVVFACGIVLTVWARLELGRNWGMPMSQKAEPELVTAGPYRLVRHPIYSGILLALLGTALATNLIGLLLAAVLGGYFYYCASVEERNLTATFPAATRPTARARRCSFPSFSSRRSSREHVGELASYSGIQPVPRPSGSRPMRRRTAIDRSRRRRTGETRDGC